MAPRFRCSESERRPLSSFVTLFACSRARPPRGKTWLSSESETRPGANDRIRHGSVGSSAEPSGLPYAKDRCRGEHKNACRRFGHAGGTAAGRECGERNKPRGVRDEDRNSAAKTREGYVDDTKRRQIAEFQYEIANVP